MTCKTFKKQADAWLAGQVSADVAEAMASHMAECPECADVARFHHRVSLELSGEATLDGAMRYRLATELNAVEEKPARIVWKEGFGGQIMRKAVWPVTAVVVAFATYSVVAPNGVAAVTLRNKLNSAKESVKGSDLNLNVKENKPLDDVLVRQVAASQISEEEKAFMSAFKVTIDVRNENGKETNMLSIDYDHSKFDKTTGDKPGVSYVTSKAHPNLRAVLRDGSGSDEFDALTFQRKNGDKWETIDMPDEKRMAIVDKAISLGDGMDIDLKGLDGLGSVIADSLDSIEITALDGDGNTLGQNKKLTEEQKKQIQEAMEKAKAEIDKAREEIRKQLSSKDMGGGSEMTNDQRALVQKALEKAQEALKKVQEAMGPKMLQLMETIQTANGKPLTPEQQEKLKKQMKELKIVLDKDQLKAALAGVDGKAMALELKKAQIAGMKDKQMAIEIQKAKIAGMGGNVSVAKSLGSKGVRIAFKDDNGTITIGDDVIKISKSNNVWKMDYDHAKWKEVPGPSDNVTVLVSKTDPNRRLVITKASDGGPVKLTVQNQKAGKWTTEQSMGFGRTGGVASSVG